MELEGRHELSQRSTDCKDINLWHSVDGGATEYEVALLIGAFIRALQPELVVETGAYHGDTSVVIGEALRENGHGKLVAIEKQTSRFRAVRRRCKGLPVEVVHGSSLDWVPEEGQKIEFAFFDTDFRARHQDFDHYWPYMSKYTVICWHDSGWHFRRPIRPRIEKFASDGIVQPIFLPTPRGVCFARLMRGHDGEIFSHNGSV